MSSTSCFPIISDNCFIVIDQLDTNVSQIWLNVPSIETVKKVKHNKHIALTRIHDKLSALDVTDPSFAGTLVGLHPKIMVGQNHKCLTKALHMQH